MLPETRPPLKSLDKANKPLLLHFYCVLVWFLATFLLTFLLLCPFPRQSRAFNGGHAIVHEGAGTHPRLSLRAICHASETEYELIRF